MLGKQTQEVSGGSTAIQSTGHVVVHQHGFSAAQVGEVSTLVDLFLKAQLPAFEARAQKIAEENAAKLLDAFVAHAANAAMPLSGEEFSKPAGQAAFHSALAGVALHADAADIDLVAEALARRLNSAEEPLLKLVLDSVIAVLPKLSAGHISFLAFTHFVKKLNLGLKSLEVLENLAGQIMTLFEAGENLSAPNIQYLAGLGLITVNPVSDADLLFSIWERTYGFPINTVEIAKLQTQHLKRVHEMYLRMKLPTVHPTITGTAIGLLHLKRKFIRIELADHIA